MANSELKPEETIKLLREAILSTNRCIYNWSESGRFAKQKLSHTDVRGLMINWFHRTMRLYISTRRVTNLFRSCTLHVYTDFNGYISKLEVQDYPSYCTELGIIKDLNKIFEEFDYKSCYYYPDMNLSSASSIPYDLHSAKTLEEINFKSIENIKF